MPTLPVILFAIAALGGGTLATIRFMGRNPPAALALLHGGLAAGAVVSLLLAVLEGAGTNLSRIALALFIAAALGGVTMFLFFHLRGKLLPIPLMLLHGLAAVTGFVLLVSDWARG